MLRVSLAQPAAKKAHLFHAHYLEIEMAAAKSLTPIELEKVLAYTATQPYAQRNRAMLLMTVAAGLRVSEVSGLTLGDVLDSTGESPRVLRRLHTLRRWSHEQEIKPFFT
jgi:site-specific recombinase XerD